MARLTAYVELAWASANHLEEGRVASILSQSLVISGIWSGRQSWWTKEQSFWATMMSQYAIVHLICLITFLAINVHGPWYLAHEEITVPLGFSYVSRGDTWKMKRYFHCRLRKVRFLLTAKTKKMITIISNRLLPSLAFFKILEEGNTFYFSRMKMQNRILWHTPCWS